MFFAERTMTSIGLLGTGWPNGQPFLEQEELVVQVFDICTNKLLTHIEGKRNV